MPWKASSVMEERLRSVTRFLDGEAMTDEISAYPVRPAIRFSFAIKSTDWPP